VQQDGFRLTEAEGTCDLHVSGGAVRHAGGSRPLYELRYLLCLDVESCTDTHDQISEKKGCPDRLEDPAPRAPRIGALAECGERALGVLLRLGQRAKSAPQPIIERHR